MLVVCSTAAATSVTSNQPDAVGSADAGSGGGMMSKNANEPDGAGSGDQPPVVTAGFDPFFWVPIVWREKDRRKDTIGATDQDIKTEENNKAKYSAELTQALIDQKLDISAAQGEINKGRQNFDTDLTHYEMTWDPTLKKQLDSLDWQTRLALLREIEKNKPAGKADELGKKLDANDKELARLRNQRGRQVRDNSVVGSGQAIKDLMPAWLQRLLFGASK